MRAGLRAKGRRKWLAETTDMGRIAAKSVIRQSYGTNGAIAIMMMATMKSRDIVIENLN